MRAREKSSKPVQHETIAAESGSFSPGAMTDKEVDQFEAELDEIADPMMRNRALTEHWVGRLAAMQAQVDVPIAAGKRR